MVARLAICAALRTWLNVHIDFILTALGIYGHLDLKTKGNIANIFLTMMNITQAGTVALLRQAPGGQPQGRIKDGYQDALQQMEAHTGRREHRPNHNTCRRLHR